MLSLSDEAVEFAIEKQRPICIDIPCSIEGCCFDIVDRPSVTLGEPRNPDEYVRRTLNGISVFVPRKFPDNVPLVIRIRKLFGFRQLVIDGWRLA